MVVSVGSLNEPPGGYLMTFFWSIPLIYPSSPVREKGEWYWKGATYAILEVVSVGYSPV